MFSVIIPLYNKAHTIERTLQSVLAQTFREFEVVIVNDGSTDDGADKARRIPDSRIRVIDQRNQGVSAARNQGIAHSSQPFIALIDGDDEWLPGFLEKMREAIIQFPRAGLYGCSSLHRNLISGESDDATLGRYRDKVQVVDYFENPHTMPHTSAMVMSREVYARAFPDGLGFPVGMKCCEDWCCFYRVAFHAPLVYVGTPLAIRNNNVPGQVTHASGADESVFIPHIVRFYNLTHEAGRATGSITYHRFLRYDLRHRMLGFLKTRDWKLMQAFVEGLEDDLRRQFLPGELGLYGTRMLRLLSMMFIYATKVIWRTHRYPVTGLKY